MSSRAPRPRRAAAAAIALLAALLPARAGAPDAATLRARLHDAQLAWFQDHPIRATLAGLHEWDRMPPNLSAHVLAARLARAKRLIAEAAPVAPSSWSREDRIASAIYRALLEEEIFELFSRRRVERDASLPLEQAILGIFSHMIRESPARLERAKWAFWRLKGIPTAVDVSYRSLSAPEAYGARRALLLAAAIPPLFNEKLTALARGIPPNHQAELRAAQESAEGSLAIFAEALRPRIPGLPEMRPLGKAAYESMLQRAHLVPLTAEEAAGAAESELARAKALAGDGGKERKKPPPAGRARSIALRGAGAALAEMAEKLRGANLVSLPDKPLPFELLEMPEPVALAFPDGLAVPAGPFEPDVPSIFFLPPEKTAAGGFYLDEALAEPALLLASQALPGRSLAAAVANGIGDEARRWSRDLVTVNGWSHYAEELALDAGLLDGGEAARDAAVRLMRSHAARAIVEIRFHSGSWTLEQAVAFLAEEEDLSLAKAKEETLRAASAPGEAMSFTIGKWQIRELRGRMADAKGEAFSLRAFHDAFLAEGPIPVCLIEWAMTGDDASYRKALGLADADKSPPPAPGVRARTGSR